MRVYPEQLANQLKSVKPCYLLFGDDPWLIESSKQQIIHSLKKKGFEEIIQLNSQDTGFHWDQVLQEWQAMSLFSSKRIIELTLPQGKPGADGSAIFQSLFQSSNSDTILLLIGPKIGLDQTKSKWFKTLDDNGLYVPCATPEGAQFNRWLTNRVQHFNLTLNQDAKALLVNLFEGNLLAADQSLKLLQLLSPNKLVTAENLQQYFEDQSRFSAFQLTDSLLENKQSKAQHMLAQLKAEGTAMPILLWSLFKELTLLLTIKMALAQQQNISSLWAKNRIWDKRKPLYQQALDRLTLEQIEAMLAFASTLELLLKRQGIEDWVGLSHLCLLFDPAAHRAFEHISASYTETI